MSIGVTASMAMAQDAKFACIPKLTGAGFFESGGAGAKAMGEALKRAEEKGLKVLTWASDVNPECRSCDIDQGRPEQLCAPLVRMTADQMKDPTVAKKVAFHHSSPTGTDQNQWAEVAKAMIGEEYPSWDIVAAEFSGNDAWKAVQVPGALYQTHPDLDAIICPDANALPGSAQAAANLGVAAKIIVIGLSTPNTMRQYVKSGADGQFGLWDVVMPGKHSAFSANELVKAPPGKRAP